MRGYAPTEIPADGDFSARALAADVNALHDALAGDGNAVLIAHDWGAVASYGALAAAPDRWRRAVIGNVPHLSVYGRVGLRYEQIKRSFYFWFFQMAVSEAIVAADDLAFIGRLWRDWSPGYDPEPELARAKACLREPGHLRAAMGYYKQTFEPSRFATPEWMRESAEVGGRPVPQPTLYLHGSDDGCIALDDETLGAMRPVLGPGSEVERVPGAGHFFWVERPQRVNDRVLRFLQRG